MSPHLVLNLIAQSIYDKKGFNTLALDVHHLSSVTDYVIIAEGHVDKHVIAIAEEIIANLEKNGLRPSYTAGMKTGDWVVLDYLHFMVHLFMPGLRDHYNLEQLWPQSTLVDLDINDSSVECKERNSKSVFQKRILRM